MSINKIILLGTVEETPILEGNCTTLKIRTTDRNHQVIHQVLVEGRKAENCVRYLYAGRQVSIEGSLYYSRPNAPVQIVAHWVEFLGPKQPPQERQELEESQEDYEPYTPSHYDDIDPAQVERDYWNGLYDAMGLTDQSDIDCFWDAL